MQNRRFPIRFEPCYSALSTLLLILPGDSYVEVDRAEVRVRMGWAFRCRFPRTAVAGTSVLVTRPLSRGVHGFAGRWLVNGSGDGILTIDLSPSQRGYVMGFPVRLRQLLVSVDAPEALAIALQGD